jgi:hypothetical protein
MSRFTRAETEITGKTYRGREIVRLLTPLSYEVGFLGSGMMLAAEAGFECDGVSYPTWLPAWVVNRMPLELMSRSAIVHDKARKDTRYPKLLGDYIFFEAMGVEEVPMFWRVVCTLAVLANVSRY